MAEDQVTPPHQPDMITEVPGGGGARANLSVVPDLIDAAPLTEEQRAAAEQTLVPTPQPLIDRVPGQESPVSTETPNRDTVIIPAEQAADNSALQALKARTEANFPTDVAEPAPVAPELPTTLPKDSPQ